MYSKFMRQAFRGGAFFVSGVTFILSSAMSAESDTITVTASKRVQNLNDIAVSVDVISGAQIDKANGFNSAEEITQLLSGVQAAVANGNQIAFQIRGIGAVDHQALTPTAAAVYMDGVFLATNVQTGPLVYDLDRIEVLKGPQGSLYGRNASSGAVNFISAAPSEETSGYLGWSYGRFDRLDASGALGGSLGGGFSGRIAGRYLKQDAALNNVQTDPNVTAPKRAGGERDEFGLRGSLQWQGEGARFLLRAHYEEDNGVNPAPRNLNLDVGKHEISVGPDGVQDTDNEFYGVSLEAVVPAGEWELFSLTALEGYRQDYGFDFDGASAPFGDPALNANLHYDREFLQWSEEIRLQGDWSLGHSLIGVAAAGEDFEQEYLIWCGELDPATRLGTCRYVGAPGRVGPTPASPGVATTLVNDIEQTRKIAAIFTYNDIILTDALTLTLGARYTYENIKGEGQGVHIFDDGVIAFNNRDGLGPAIGENRIKENRLSGNAALSYRFSDAAMIYASFSNGYKSGGFNGEVQNNAAHFRDEGLFRAETVNAYELGYKGEPAPGLSLRAAAFYQDYDAPQARLFVNFALPGGGSITSNSLSNLDKAKAYGVEGGFDWAASEAFTLGGSVTLLETEISQTTDIGGNAALFDGNPLPFASDVSATGFARYVRELGGGASLALQANAKYQSAFYLDAEGLAERRQGAYTIADAGAALVFDNGLELALRGRNLLNKDYAVSGYGFIGYNVFVGPPRSWEIAIRKQF
ncbi:TonB-dependent receptor [Hyphococcus sp.]|uniref:TonB-dependent receptor n=1 Tax=Hyphococcus sp. TaxID=2038636 RepID=UPI003CCB80FE